MWCQASLVEILFISPCSLLIKKFVSLLMLKAQDNFADACCDLSAWCVSPSGRHMTYDVMGPEANSHHDKFPPRWESVRDDDGGNLSVTKSHHWRWWWWLWIIICKKCARSPPVFLQIFPRQRNSSHCFGHPVTLQIFVTFWEWTGSIS